MTVDLLELAAAALDDLLEEVVFVGGATIVLWITDPAAPPPRPTKDVDVIVMTPREMTARDYVQAAQVTPPSPSHCDSRVEACVVRKRPDIGRFRTSN